MEDTRIALDSASEKRDTFGATEAVIAVGTAVAGGGFKIASDIIKDRGETLRERIRQDGATKRARLGKSDPK